MTNYYWLQFEFTTKYIFPLPILANYILTLIICCELFINIVFLFQKTIGAIMNRICMIEPRIYISISFHSTKNIYRWDEHKEFTFHFFHVFEKKKCMFKYMFIYLRKIFSNLIFFIYNIISYICIRDFYI